MWPRLILRGWIPASDCPVVPQVCFNVAAPDLRGWDVIEFMRREHGIASMWPR